MSRRKSEAEVPIDPADQVERWPLERLIPYARNAKVHTDEQVAQIAASMREFGWTIPVLVDEEGTLIAGHGRILAARLLQRTHAPVLVARGWSEAKKRAYRLADNQLAARASWDPEMLGLELKDLVAEEFDLEVIGFPEEELEALVNGWQSDVDPAEKDGEHLDGIHATVRVIVAQEDRDAARAAIEQALRQAEVKYELR